MRGVEYHKPELPLPPPRAPMAATIPIGTGSAAAARAVLPAVDTTDAAVAKAPAAPTGGTAPAAPRAALPAVVAAAPPTTAATALLFLLLPVRSALLLLFSCSPRRSKARWPWRPLPNKRSLDLLVCSTDLPRKLVAARPITEGDRVAHTTRLERLEGSFLSLERRRLDPPRRRQGSSRDVAPLRRLKWGPLDIRRRTGIGGSCTHPKAGR